MKRNKPKIAISWVDLYDVRESVRNYIRATELDPTKTYYWLGLGWMLEQGAPYASRIGAPWNPRSNKKQTASSAQWLNRALAAYRHAYELEMSGDSPQRYNGLAIEAGEYILRIQALRKRSLTSKEKVEVRQIRHNIEKIKQRPQLVTPIILPLGRSTSLPSLLSKKSVTFELTGNNLGKRWPWVGSDTGILVWDPQQTGRITSGRQLFGSVTWWIFWQNGYQALAALDNDADGTLTGHELEGISIWRDANGNGISDLGEVKPLSELDIVAVSTRVTQQVQGMPANLRGITRGDGTVVPSYDWTPRSLN